jgi:hypothetical protein
MASTIFKVYIEVYMPCLSGGEIYEKVNKLSIPSDFNRKTTLSKLEFSISGIFPSGLALKLYSQ